MDKPSALLPARTMSDPGSPTHANALRAARNRGGLDARAAAGAAGLAAETVGALEQASAGAVRADARLQAQMRTYARSLGVDPEPLLHELTGGSVAGELPSASASDVASTVRTRRRRAAVTLAATTIGAAVAALAAVVFSLYNEPQERLTAPSTPTAAMEHANPDSDEASTIDVNPPVDERPVLERPPTTTDTTSDEHAGEESADDEADEDGQADSAALPGSAPEETSVQLLDGARDPRATAAAEDALTALGYEVVAVEATADLWDETAVYYTTGWQEEASSLSERDGRFTIGGENPGFLADVALHVIVGADWMD